jgi:GMP synthase-like glutamine amidotransferase
MRVHAFQHVPFEALGAIEPWLAARDARITWTRFFADTSIPSPDSYDWLIVMGGPMSVNDEARLPWLRDEKCAIAAAIDAGKTVFGVCFGAQLIANAWGAAVTPNREREIGWWPIERVPGADAHPIGRALPAQAEVFQWHGETFEVPRGAVHLARSEGCEAQAFALGDRVVGMQFHLETTRESAAALVRHRPEDLKPGRYVQSGEATLADASRFERLRMLLEDVLSAIPR